MLAQSLRRAVGGILLAGLVLCAFDSVGAQNPAYTFTAPNANVAPSGFGTGTVVFDNSIGMATQGFSFAVCHDPLIASVANATVGVDMLTINAGGPADFAQVDTPPGGVTIGLVVDLLGVEMIPPANNWQVLDVEYFGLGPVGSLSVTQICSLGAPPVQPAVVVNGGQITPTGVNGLLEILPPAAVTYSIDAPNLAFPNDSVVTFVNLTSSLDVEQFTFGLEYDSSQLTLQGVSPAGVLAATNGGAGPDFLAVNLFPGGGIGATVQCEITQTGVSDFIPTGLDQQILALDFDVSFAAGPPCSIAEIGFTDTLGMPQVPLSAVTPAGLVNAAGITGGVEIGVPPPAPPTGGITLAADILSVSPGDPAAVRVTLDTDTEIEAISFGIAFDATDVALSSVDQGVTLATLRCGLGPEFYSADEFGFPNSGVTIAAVFAISPPLLGRSLSPGSDQEIVVLNFVTNPAPSTAGSPLTFTDTLGNPPVSVEVTVDGQAVTPNLLDGAVQLGPSTGNFVRGDCNLDSNIDLADAIFLLGALFPGPGGPQVPLCDDGCDGNDDGAINLADAITILGALFGMTAPLPAPDVCGPDPTLDGLGCLSSPCP